MRRLLALFLFAALPASAAQRSSVLAFQPAPADLAILNAAGPGQAAEKALAAMRDKPLLTRWVGSTRGDRVRVFCFYRQNNQSVGVEFKEEPRQTVFEKQFETLVKLAGGPGGRPLATPLTLIRADRVLEETRANLTITAKTSDSEKGTQIAVDEDAEVNWVVIIDMSTDRADGNVDEVSKTFITGPREAWSISAAVPLDRMSQFKFNEETQQTELTEKPTSFYAGFDFTLGDAIGQPRTLRDAIALKLLVRASRKPFDSYGVALGLRPGAFTLLMPNTRIVQMLNTFTPFVAYLTSKEDKKGEGEAGIGKGKTNDIRWGVSLDISNALQWVKK